MTQPEDVVHPEDCDELAAIEIMCSTNACSVHAGLEDAYLLGYSRCCLDWAEEPPEDDNEEEENEHDNP